jgi:hypothetical protein
VDALRTIGFGNAVADVAPDKEPRRMIGQFGDGLDLLRPRKEACGAGEMFGPIETLRRTKCRNAANGSLRQDHTTSSSRLEPRRGAEWSGLRSAPPRNSQGE